MERELNNASLYGESVFASFKVDQQGIFQWPVHKARLLKSICYLFFHRDPLPEDEAPFEHLLEPFYLSLKTLNRSEDFYCRITIYRSAYVFAKACEGWEELKGNSLLRVYVCPPRQELSVSVSDWVLHPRYWPCDYKKEDYSLRQSERLKAMPHQDVLFINDKKGVVELSTSNLLFQKHDEFIIPDVDGYCYQGVELIGIQKFFEETQKKFTKQEVKPIDLKKFTGAWGLNSVKSLQPIKTIVGLADYQYDQARLDWEQEYLDYRKKYSVWPF